VNINESQKETTIPIDVHSLALYLIFDRNENRVMMDRSTMCSNDCSPVQQHANYSTDDDVYFKPAF